MKKTYFAFRGDKIIQASVVPAVVYLYDVFGGAYVPSVYYAWLLCLARYFCYRIYRLSATVLGGIAIVSTVVVVISGRTNGRLVSGCFLFIARIMWSLFWTSGFAFLLTSVDYFGGAGRVRSVAHSYLRYFSGTGIFVCILVGPAMVSKGAQVFPASLFSVGLYVCWSPFFFYFFSPVELVKRFTARWDDFLFISSVFCV